MAIGLLIGLRSKMTRRMHLAAIRLQSDMTTEIPLNLSQKSPFRGNSGFRLPPDNSRLMPSTVRLANRLWGRRYLLELH